MTVYVLGAGASWHAGYPLASEMGKGLLDWMQVNRPDLEWHIVAEQITERFSNTASFEELLTALQERLEPLLHSQVHDEIVERVILLNCRAALRTALREWFRTLRNNGASAYSIFAERVIKPGDIIVSFNYDDRAERELRGAGVWDIRGGYGFPIMPGASENSYVDFEATRQRQLACIHIRRHHVRRFCHRHRRVPG